MNCPQCSAPLLFGSRSCPCGYNVSSAPEEALPIELSYWESLRAYWRLYWPTQALGFLLMSFVGMLVVRAGPAAVGALPIFALQIAVGALGTYLFVPRICERPYRGFSLAAVSVATGETMNKLRGRARAQVFVFLWWRQVVAGLAASFLAGPLNVVLSIMGVHVEQWVAVFAGVLVIGPILLKMLIGHEFETFRIEARRGEGTGAGGRGGGIAVVFQICW